MEKGLLDFAVICETPDINKFNYLPFPGTDLWGAIMRKDHKLANKRYIQAEDLIGQALFCSDQSWANDIPSWAEENFSRLHLEGSFRLSFTVLCSLQKVLASFLALKTSLTALRKVI